MNKKETEVLKLLKRNNLNLLKNDNSNDLKISCAKESEKDNIKRNSYKIFQLDGKVGYI